MILCVGKQFICCCITTNSRLPAQECQLAAGNSKSDARWHAVKLGVDRSHITGAQTAAYKLLTPENTKIGNVMGSQDDVGLCKLVTSMPTMHYDMSFTSWLYEVPIRVVVGSYSCREFVRALILVVSYYF